jgi:L-amino acid N-acyltransferase YncA
VGFNALPKMLTLRDGRPVKLGFLDTVDRPSLIEFYRSLPEQDRQVLRDDVTTKEWADRFLHKVAAGEVISLVAKEGEQVVGEGSIYKGSHGWTKHVCEIRLNTARSHRRQGLGLAMANTLVKVATDLGVEKILVNLVENQLGTRRTFEKLGFNQEAVLRRHVKDISGVKRDLIVMASDVSHVWDAMESLVQDHAPHCSE